MMRTDCVLGRCSVVRSRSILRSRLRPSPPPIVPYLLPLPFSFPVFSLSLVFPCPLFSFLFQLLLHVPSSSLLTIIIATVIIAIIPPVVSDSASNERYTRQNQRYCNRKSDDAAFGKAGAGCLGRLGAVAREVRRGRCRAQGTPRCCWGRTELRLLGVLTWKKTDVRAKWDRC